MIFPANILRSYRFFRDVRKLPAHIALAYARAEAWVEEHEDSVRVRFVYADDHDWSYLDQDCWKRDKARILEQVSQEIIQPWNCTVEVLRVTPACTHCGRAETRVWEFGSQLCGIELVQGDSYRREVTAELLCEAMPARRSVNAKELQAVGEVLGEMGLL